MGHHEGILRESPFLESPLYEELKGFRERERETVGGRVRVWDFKKCGFLLCITSEKEREDSEILFVMFSTISRYLF